MEKRTVLAIVLSIIVVFVYQFFFMKPPTIQKPVVPKETAAAKSAEQVKAPAAGTSVAGGEPSTGRKTSTAADSDYDGEGCSC